MRLGRPRLDPSLRSAVLRKTLGRCWYCGEGIVGRVHLDHQLARSAGGKDDYENLLPVCSPCNLSKSSKSLEEWREYVGERVTEAMASLIDSIASQTWFSESLADVEITNCLRSYLACIGSRRVVFYGESFAAPDVYCI